jgi:hypothetical protein
MGSPCSVDNRLHLAEMLVDGKNQCNLSYP